MPSRKAAGASTGVLQPLRHTLELLPKRIEELEPTIAAHGEAMAKPECFKQDSAAINKANEAVAKQQKELEAAYARWSELDG